MTYRKNRNFIEAIENNSIVGKFNCIDGKYIGKSDKIVKTKPAAFKREFLLNEALTVENGNLLAKAIYFYENYKGGSNGNFTKLYNWNNRRYYTKAELLNAIETLISVNLPACRQGDVELILHSENGARPLTKEAVLYIQNFLGESITSIQHENLINIYERFLVYNKIKNYTINLDEDCKVLFEETVNTNNFPTDATTLKWLRSQIEVAKRENLINEIRIRNYRNDMQTQGFYCSPSFLRDLRIMLLEIQGKLSCVHEMLTSFQKYMAILYEKSKNDLDENLRKYNDKPWLYYQNEQLFARPLVSGDEFHDEGTKQSNCIERLYMSAVAKGSTHIIQIRRKEAPLNSYITCEVDNSGNIKQYLAKHNTQVRSEEGLDFKAEYAAHLRSYKPNC